jgi:hypothetical protein
LSARRIPVVALGLAAVCALGSHAPASASVYPGFIELLTDSMLTVSVPATVRPGYLAPVTDPRFGSKVVRIAGDTGTPIGGGVSGNWGSDVRQHYSKDQPWNSDNTLIALQNDGGGMVLLDGETYQPVKGKCNGYSLGDDRWHPSPAHPHERINVSGSELMWYDVVNCVKTRSWTLPYAVQYFGPSEGNPSFDGRFAALTDGARMFVVDMDPQAPFAPWPAQRIGPSVAINECGLSGGCTIDWVSISPSGKYAVVSYDGDFPRVFDVNPATLELTPRAMPSTSLRCHGTAAAGFIYDLGHADMTLNPFDSNEDVIIGQEHCGNRGRTVGGILMSGVVMVRLKDDAITPLTNSSNEGYPHHISTRNYDRPGWAYVGYHTESGKKFTDEIIAVKLDGSQAVQRFAHKHSAYSGCYRCESHSVPSRDGRRVMWASNWAANCLTCGSSSDIKPFIVDARGGAPDGPDTVPPNAITDLTVQ